MKPLSFEEYQKIEFKHNISGVYEDSFGKKHYLYAGAELNKRQYRKIILEMIKTAELLFALANTEEDVKEASFELVRDLEERYNEPGRFYHNLEHYRYVLNLFESIKSNLKHPESVDIALSFHDVFYDPKEAPGVNEIRSANFMHECLDGLIKPEALARAEKIILATANSCGATQLDVDSDTAYALDCDLAILGESPEKYMQYERNIRKEYSFCNFDEYCQGRIQFLMTLLMRPKIFYTELFQGTCEEQARKNITSAIELLTTRQPGLF